MYLKPNFIAALFFFFFSPKAVVSREELGWLLVFVFLNWLVIVNGIISGCVALLFAGKY